MDALKQAYNAYLQTGTDSDVLHSRDESGWTPLHVAAYHGDADLVSFLTQTLSADVNATNLAGDTPLHKAAISSPPASSALLAVPGIDLTARNLAGDSALHKAAGAASPSIVAALIARGADVGGYNLGGLRPIDVVGSIEYALLPDRDVDACRALLNAAMPEVGGEVGGEVVGEEEVVVVVVGVDVATQTVWEGGEVGVQVGEVGVDVGVQSGEDVGDGGDGGDGGGEVDMEEVEALRAQIRIMEMTQRILKEQLAAAQIERDAANESLDELQDEFQSLLDESVEEVEGLD